MAARLSFLLLVALLVAVGFLRFGLGESGVLVDGSFVIIAIATLILIVRYWTMALEGLGRSMQQVQSHSPKEPYRRS